MRAAQALPSRPAASCRPRARPTRSRPARSERSRRATPPQLRPPARPPTSCVPRSPPPARLSGRAHADQFCLSARAVPPVVHVVRRARGLGARLPRAERQQRVVRRAPPGQGRRRAAAPRVGRVRHGARAEQEGVEGQGGEGASLLSLARPRTLSCPACDLLTYFIRRMSAGGDSCGTSCPPEPSLPTLAPLPPRPRLARPGTLIPSNLDDTLDFLLPQTLGPYHPLPLRRPRARAYSASRRPHTPCSPLPRQLCTFCASPASLDLSHELLSSLERRR